VKLFVPGRICLLGEHSDWAGGYRRMNAEIEKGHAIICGTNQGLYAEVEPHPNALVLTSTMPDGKTLGPYEIPMRPDTLMEEAQKGGFFSYAAGVAYNALTNYHVRGLVINNYKTDLPIKKGLSSSAAICVLAARAFNRVYDLKLTIRGEMEMAYQGEITTPSRCGRMDQGCAFGNHPVWMTFDGDRLETKEIRVKQDFYLVVVDLQAHKDTMEILNRLNRCFPIAENEMEENVQRLLGPINREIIHSAIEAIEDSDPARLGKVMVEAQGYFDEYATPVCPDELTAPVLHRVLHHEALQPYIWGAKGVGSQGDGTAQFLARSAEAQDKIIEILKRDFDMAGLKLTLESGAKVRKAVIPAAGFGTRLFPATKATKKELFPVIDRDGIAKPAILIIVEEALSAGIEEVIIVVQKDDLNDFQSFFNRQISIENYNKLPANFQEYSRRILEMGQHVSFVIQQNQEGFGHAVYSTRDAIGDEPFLLMLGDHIYRSNNHISCAQQMLDAYQRYGTSVVGLKRTQQDLIGGFGVVNGSWLEDKQILGITEFAEKPTLDYAQNHLRVPGIPDDEYLTVFGQYVVKPDLFDLLDSNIKNNVRERGEFQLTSVLDRLRQFDGFNGLMIDGQRFDIGIPDRYLESLQAFRQP
jgi:UTP-glucose-1-phosphate uridylyltransferase/mevalonate kinase